MAIKITRPGLKRVNRMSVLACKTAFFTQSGPVKGGHKGKMGHANRKFSEVTDGNRGTER
jgi:hypothetical protein